MNILITGANGFVGKNLTHALRCIKDGKDRTHPELQINDIYEFDVDTDASLLDDFCKKLKEHEKVLKQAENNKVKVSVELNEVKPEPAKIDNKNITEKKVFETKNKQKTNIT